MAVTEALRLLIDADTRGAVRGISDVAKATDKLSKSEKQIDRWGRGLTTAGAGAVAFGSAALVGLGMAAKSAADLEQAVGGTEAVFGSAGKVIDDYAGNAADKLGLSEKAFRELTTVAGAQLKNLGFSVDEAADQSIRLTEIGADLAATYGGTTAEAVQALGAAFRGEADPAERFGLSLNQTAVNAKAVELGLARSTGSVDANAKAQATLALITEQSADAQGQFAREADTAAGKQARLSASFENLKAAIGEGALPVFEAFTDVASKGVGAFQAVDDATGGLVGKFAAFGSVAAVVGGGLSFTIGQLLLAKQRFGDAASTVRDLSAKLGGLKNAAALAGGVAGVAGLAFALKQVDDAMERTQTQQATEAFLALEGASSEAFEAMLGSWGGAIFAEGVLKNLLAMGNITGAERLLEMAEAAGVSGGALDKLRGMVDQKAAADRQAASDQQANTDATNEATDAYANAAEAVQAYTDNLNAQFDPVFGVISAQQSLSEAVANQVETYKNAESTANDKAAADQRVREAVVELDGAAGNLNRRIADGSVTVQTARDRFVTMATQMGVTKADAIRLADGMLQATNRARDLGNTDPNVAITATDRASDVIKRVKGRVLDLDGRTASILIQTTHRDIFESQRRGGTTGGPQLRQHGGPVRAGDPYIVGERGPELFVPAQHGTVVPAMSHGGAAGGTYNDNRHVTYEIRSNDPTAVVEAIKRYERTNGNAWRQ